MEGKIMNSYMCEILLGPGDTEIAKICPVIEKFVLR